MCACLLSCSLVSHSATPRTVTRQVPLSMGFSREEHWSELPCPPPGIFPTQGLNPRLLHLLRWQVGFLPRSQPGSPTLKLLNQNLHFNKILVGSACMSKCEKKWWGNPPILPLLVVLMKQPAPWEVPCELGILLTASEHWRSPKQLG